ncbi:MAG: D-2-hydroxyacid dehydrogenase [Oscillospiraceae bacterium]|nr:D-2-hydroxyacid dehydrogenase [Oscillospiraceae bacterium]
MNIVILDSVSANPGDLSWDFLKKYGELTVYDRSLTEDLVIERAKEAEIVILNKTVITRRVVENLPKLRLIALLATGYNVIDCAACSECGVMVANVPSYSGFAVAQQTFAFILEYANRVALHSESVLSGGWAGSPDFSYFLSPLCELKNKTIGLIGYGNIGKKVAEIARVFEMRVLVNTAHPEKYPDAPVEFKNLDEMLPQCDFVSLHAPLTPETNGLVNKNFISKMKTGAFLVNNARGGELNEQDVADALNSGKLGGLGADVLSTEPPKADNPLLSAKNVFITPHIAWASLETRTRLMGILEKNISCFIEGKPQNIVNM